MTTSEQQLKTLADLSDIVRAELERYISYISDMDSVLQIYLFGSCAHGIPTDDSDIDLMVIVHDGIDTLQVMQSISRGLIDRQVSLDVLVDTISDFIELSNPARVTLQREIKNKGILVYG